MNLAHSVLLLLIFLFAVLALWFRNLYHSIMAMAAFSLLLALEFYLLQAPDVAIAEAGIGAGLSTVIALIALSACRKKTTNKEEQR
ncbi:MAG: DUF4040 domain-containing protein [Synergistaceae bacterium]|nr:DUF4040 domain-containing protein [Synergistaceae bacterium]